MFCIFLIKGIIARVIRLAWLVFFLFLCWSVIRVDAEVIAGWNYSVAWKVLVGVFKCGAISDWYISLTLHTESNRYINICLLTNTWRKKQIVQNRKIWMPALSCHAWAWDRHWLPGNHCWLSALSNLESSDIPFFNDPLEKHTIIAGHH